MTRNAASERQVQAAHPRASTWLAANAGSGKTRVLTDRVARLLLAGVEPARILCLTYTKAAASEMQNRLFRRLGEWAMKPDADLGAALADLGIEGGVSRETLADARRLFARAIETPGGLRIQTIHSFCASLLRRFPLEAGVSPQFTEMDDRAAKLLREEIVEEMAERQAPGAVAALAQLYTGEDFGQLTAEIARQSAALTPPLSPAACRALFGVPEMLTRDALIAQVLLGGEAELLAETAAILLGGSTNDAKAGQKMASVTLDAPSLATLAALEGVLLFGESKVEGKSYTAKGAALATKATAPKLALLQDRVDALGLRVEAARPLRLGLIAAERSAALHAFAAAFLPLYTQRKMLRGALDFDDLIARAKALLTDPAVAQWVLFRLDGGIDHILVDEAQDTSPDQWRVIELLAQEFTSGAGAREVERTIFVVGDQKQSIYSFQGADVSAFAKMRAVFRDRLSAIEAPFQTLELEHSFRSSPAILRLVDETFPPHLHPDLGGASHHIAFREAMPGRVEIWPPIAASANPEDEDWTDPVDLITGEHHAAELGRRVAARIKQILEAGTLIPGETGPRPVHAGDFLILVRRRSPLFSEIIRACKAARLPIAGADRLHLGGEMAVKDITALLAFLATPEDDLALAELLRSPLFGWSEAQLYALAQPRKGYLWAALRDSGPSDTLTILQDLRDQADYLRPFDLIERALTRHDGRRRLLARLGAEAEDGIDELLSQALAYERNDVPSLTGFLTWLQTDEVQVKRQMDSAGQKIRVMTVHGSKGLEAPIVILPDTADYTAPDRDELFRMGETAIWRTPTADSPPAIAAIRRERREKVRAESMRLLYVAMTRAQSWLIVAAAGPLGSQSDKKNEDRLPAWYDLIRAGAERAGAEAGLEGRLVLGFGDWPSGETVSDSAEIEGNPPLPDWLRRPAPEAPRPPQPIKPSDLGGAKVLPGDHEGESAGALQRGTWLHALLEHLPAYDPTHWPALATSLIPDDAQRPALLAEAERVIRAPELAALFTPDALAEVAITASHDNQPLSGAIDRLIVREDRVLAVDYKSNALVPSRPEDVPEGLRRQMAAYRAALQQIYPGRKVETAILWTKTATLMPVG
ncbi:DNA helicase/exodeoxyribonuclease V, subunit A [Gemmobacter aquatilis]|uniref:DNA 3'-5' helicase n=1 Tax=Gemmobacter aquatilis TaxID=933059 RepID=A0A1H7YX10_9RHOB|nr:double-strand break repair helicase AddA [Gemmobacter aquatilis]SEM50505.1 DNA helicase/exodeoxyribonuclease V, subunit A [Gemmobacter aquatilis]